MPSLDKVGRAGGVFQHRHRRFDAVGGVVGEGVLVEGDVGRAVEDKLGLEGAEEVVEEADGGGRGRAPRRAARCGGS